MMNRSLMQRLARWLAVAVLLGAALGAGLGAMAQAEPTLKQIYDAAQAGRLEQAQTMIQQVLVLHPKSAKAHFVQAELAARQGQIARAREALAEAEKLAPGLPFAKPEAVQSLRAALVAQPATAVKPGAIAQTPQAAPFAVSTAPAPASSSQIGLGIALGGAAIALAIYLVRRKPAPVPAPQAGYGSPAAAGSGLSGPQTFGTGVSAAPCAARSRVCASVAAVRTSSRSTCTGTGLKKWVPTKRCGRRKPAPRAARDSELVLVASTASSVRCASRSRSSPDLSSRISGTASMTNRTSASACLLYTSPSPRD